VASPETQLDDYRRTPNRHRRHDRRNGLLTPVTGSIYDYQPLTDSADRQAVLPKIEAALEAGKPVPLSVAPSSAGAGHEMVIVHFSDRVTRAMAATCTDTSITCSRRPASRLCWA
jgi:hypothetical protein